MPARSPLQRRAPDPARAHGAWVYLGVSILAGILSARAQGVTAALCAGLGFVGVFLVASGLAIHPHRWRKRFYGGLALTIVATGAGVLLAADPMYLAYSSVALFPAAASVWFASRNGFLAPSALAFGVIALVVSAPAAACAGGASPGLGFLLFALLGPFFAWRTWRVRIGMNRKPAPTRKELKRTGMFEAALALVWTIGSIGVVHLLV